MTSIQTIDEASSASEETPVDGDHPESQSTGDLLEEKSGGEEEPAAEAVPEVRTTEDAIRSRLPEEVEVACKRAPRQEIARELEAMVEAFVPREHDEANIFMEERGEQYRTPLFEDGETLSEIRHHKMLLMVAAEGGSTDVFDEVMGSGGDEEAIPWLLESGKEIVPLLTAAARGGNASIFHRVKKAASGKMEEVTSSPAGQQLLFGAARGGSIDVFHTVLNMLGDRAARDVVETRSFTGYTILMAAARSGNASVVSSAGKKIAGYPDKNKVKGMLRANSREGYSCLLTAVQGGSPQVVPKVFDILKKHLSREQVERAVQVRTKEGFNVLTLAAILGERALLTQVEKIVRDTFPAGNEKKAEKMILARCGSGTFLTAAAESGNVGAVAAAEQLMGKYLSDAQARDMVELGRDPSDDCPTIFMAAALAKGNMEAVEAVVHLAQKHLKQDGVVKLMKAELRGYNIFRLVMEFDPDPRHLKAVLKMMGMLPKEQVVELMDYGDGGSSNLLILAVKNGRAEYVELVSQFVQDMDKFDKDEVLRLLEREDKERHTALMLEARRHRERPEIYQIMVNLTDECKAVTVGQGSAGEDGTTVVGASFARSDSVSSDSSGGTFAPENEDFPSQLSQDSLDNERDEEHIDQQLALPQGGVRYPLALQFGAGADSNINSDPSGAGFKARTRRRVSDVSTISEAISSGMPRVFEKTVGRMTDGQAVKELCGPANARVTPILHAARKSGDMFFAVLKSMKERLTETQMAAALAGGTDAIGFRATERKRFSHVATSDGQGSYYDSDDFMRALILVAVQGGNMEVLEMAAKQIAQDRGLPKSQLQRFFKASGDIENLFLAAARGGDIPVFDLIGDALPGQVLRKKMGGTVGKNLLNEAAKGGSIAMFRTIVDELGDKEIEAIAADKLASSTLLIKAAQSGRSQVFKHTMGLLKNKPIKELLLRAVNTTMDKRHDTVLTAVARSGKAEAIRDLMKIVAGELARGQVVSLIQTKTATGGTILTEAVGSGSWKAIKAVKEAMVEHLKSGQVSSMVRDVDPNGNNILAQAILSGSTDGLQAVADLMDDTLQKEEILAALQSPGNWRSARGPGGCNCSTLELAVGTGSRKTFEAVLRILYENLTTTQVLRMIETATIPGSSILHLCVKTGIRGVFEAAVDEMDSFPGGQVRRMMKPQETPSGNSVLAEAIMSGSAEVVEATIEVMRERLQLNEGEMRRVIQGRDAGKRNILMMAVISKDEKVFEVVVNNLRKYLPDPKDILGIVSAEDGDGRSLLAWAARQKSSVFLRAVEYIEENALEKVPDMIRKTDKSGRTIAMAAASSGEKETIEKVTEFIEKHLHDHEKVLEIIVPIAEENTETPARSILSEAAKSGKRAAVEAVRDVLMEKLDGDKVLEAFATAFEVCARDTKTDPKQSLVADRLEDVAIVLGYGAMPRKKAFAQFLQSFENETDHLKECFQYAMSSASNPFVPGMTLSVSLANAALTVVEGERRALLALQREVDGLLLEIFERLPQTVAGLISGDDDCTSMLEPETSDEYPDNFTGPLGLALTDRQHMEKFCVTPLVLDFMARKFTLGLPDLKSKVYAPVHHEDGGPEDDGRESLETNGLFHTLPLDIIGSQFGWCCSDDDARHPPSLLPGARFVLAGIVSDPFNYYGVPVLRMALDFVVYLLMLALFSTRVLVQDYRELNSGEYALAVYVVAALISEIAEIWKRPKMYLRDPWNVLDVVAIFFLAAGFVIRVVDNNEVWGQYFYALSAPALFSRILFFAQILPAQGPMIQVIHSMARELVVFGVIMVVVMFGFAMCFFTLFQDFESATYGTAWLGIFKALFGDVALFDEVDGRQVEGVATVVLIVYMTVMTIMLLNLLIAVLSTAHANVQQNVHREFEISKALMIGHYRRVVKEDMLPAPFNLVQRVVSLPFKLPRQGLTYRKTKTSVGIAVFSLVLGPVAVVAALLLSVLSIPKVVQQAWDSRMPEEKLLSRVGTVSRSVLSSCLLSPLCLTVLWLWAVFRAIARTLGFTCNKKLTDRSSTGRSSIDQASDTSNSNSVDDKKLRKRSYTVDENLKRSTGGMTVAEMRVHLENPMNDMEVRRDEETRRATVEHIKLLRDRLEDTGDQRMKPLWDELDRLGAGMSDLDGKVGDMHQTFENLSEKFDERVDEMRHMFEKLSQNMHAA